MPPKQALDKPLMSRAQRKPQFWKDLLRGGIDSATRCLKVLPLPDAIGSPR